MEERPGEDDNRSSGQEIHLLLWNQNSHYHGEISASGDSNYDPVWDAAPCSLVEIAIVLMMEAVSTSETSVSLWQTTWLSIPSLPCSQEPGGYSGSIPSQRSPLHRFFMSSFMWTADANISSKGAVAGILQRYQACYGMLSQSLGLRRIALMTTMMIMKIIIFFIYVPI
jgi:hypothetical protein